MNSDEKVCPFCAEVIKKKAIKCRFCGADLTEKLEENNEIIYDIKDISNDDEISIRDIQNGLIFFCSILPIISIFYEIELSFEFTNNYDDFIEVINHNEWIYFYLLIQSIFALFDLNQLRKLGINVKYGLISIILFFPVYLYLRGSAINKYFSVGWAKSQLFLFLFLISLIASYPLTDYLINYYYED